MQEGDVVVAATDGLFDNLTERQIVATVQRFQEQQQAQPQDQVGEGEEEEKQGCLAVMLVARAMEIAASDAAESPFAKRMYEERGTLCVTFRAHS